MKLAAAAAVLGFAALMYCTFMLADLVSGHWLAGLWAVAATFAAGGGAYLVLGRYLKVTARSRGGEHGGAPGAPPRRDR